MEKHVYLIVTTAMLIAIASAIASAALLEFEMATIFTYLFLWNAGFITTFAIMDDLERQRSLQ
jgi:hypothetical protein